MKTYRTSDSVYLSSKVSAAIFRMTLSTKPAFRPSFRFVRFSAFIVSVAIIAAASYSASSAYSSLFASARSLPKSTSASNPGGMLNVANGSINATTAYSLITEKDGGGKFGLSATGLYPALAFQALPPESIATFAADCVTQKTDFNLNETVCAKATGVPSLLFPYRVSWINPDGLVVQSETASTDPDTHYTYSPTSAGTWRVNLTRSSGAVRQSAVFTVHDTANVAADVFVQKFVRSGNASVPSGSSIAFILIVGNSGPDTAANVNLVDSVPSGSTLVSFTQQSGPPCTPTGTGNCTLSLANGERAEFTAIYDTGSSAPGTVITSATANSSTTPDSDNSNNTSTAQFEITTGAGGSQCSLTCPTPITVSNDPGTGGHIIHSADFPSPVTTGTCGTVSTTASPDPQTHDYFFPIGTSVITASTESGETCTFTVTVNDNENPAISCPANITTFESSPGSGSAIVTYDLTATDNSGSASVSCNPPSGSSFTVGTTPVTCTATDGVNTSPECSFNVTVTAVSAGCTLTPPAPIVVNSDANACGTNVTFAVGASGCGTVTCDHPSGSFFAVGQTLVTCTSSPDGASTSFTVTVNDTTAPVPDLATLPTLTRPCVVTAGVPTGPNGVIEPPTATDNCGGRIAGSTDDPRTYEDPGTYTVHWTYADASGNSSSQNQTVVVTGVDTTAPVPDLATLPTVTNECSATVTTAPTASDNCSGEIVGTTTDPLSYTGTGTYTVHWTYTDESGNSSHQNQTVVVTDVHPPTIALVGLSSVTVECHTSFSDPGVTTTDNCLPQNVNVATTGSVNVNVPATYTLTYTATDGGGNQASVQRTVTVVDTTAPTITTCATAQSLTANSCQAAVPDFTSSVVGGDTCSGVTITQIPAAGTIVGLGVTPVTITVRDAAGNTSSCATTFTVNALQFMGQVWLGLKNSDDVGTKFDLRAEVFKNGEANLIGSSEIYDVPGGSTGFNNAVQRSINVALTSPGFCTGDVLSIKLLVRVAASSGHVSGTARLWYNSSAANSRFTTTANNVTTNYYLRNVSNSLVLDTSTGSTQLTIDVLVNRNQNGNPFKPFGTWTKTF